MGIPYLDKSSDDPSLPMNKPSHARDWEKMVEAVIVAARDRSHYSRKESFRHITDVKLDEAIDAYDALFTKSR
jgi:hypothetical protein